MSENKPHAAAVRAIAKSGSGWKDLPLCITREYAALVEAARDIATSGMTDIDPRLDYIEVQISRSEWAALQAALKGVVGE